MEECDLSRIEDNLSTIRNMAVAVFFMLIIITVLLFVQVCIKLYKMHTASLRERYRLNAVHCIQAGGDKASPQSAGIIN